MNVNGVDFDFGGQPEPGCSVERLIVTSLVDQREFVIRTSLVDLAWLLMRHIGKLRLEFMIWPSKIMLARTSSGELTWWTFDEFNNVFFDRSSSLDWEIDALQRAATFHFDGEPHERPEFFVDGDFVLRSESDKDFDEEMDDDEEIMNMVELTDDEIIFLSFIDGMTHLTQVVLPEDARRLAMRDASSVMGVPLADPRESVIL